MQEFTLEQLGVQVAALKSMFDQVRVVDPLAQASVDPATLKPAEKAEGLPPLNASGRGWKPLSGDDPGFVFYQSIQVNSRPFVLAVTYYLPADLPANTREANAMQRLMSQYREDMRRDYVTGVFNPAYLDSFYRDKVAAAARAGQPVSVVAARVNEYWDLLGKEGSAAADRCLNAAAGILRLAAGMDAGQDENTVIRLGDGVFLIVCTNTSAAKMEAALRDALETSRRVFSITLARRGEFTVTLGSADWGEAGSLDLTIALAEQRLSGY